MGCLFVIVAVYKDFVTFFKIMRNGFFNILFDGFPTMAFVRGCSAQIELFFHRRSV